MIRRLLLLNGLAILGVAINHAVGWGFVAMFWWTDRYSAVDVPNFDQLGSLSYYLLRVAEQLIMFAIPAFLFVSGYFVAVATGRTQKTVPWRTIGNRISTLLLPYVLWSLVMFSSDFVQGTSYSAVQYLRLLLIGGAAPAFYYVPVIVQLYLLSPVLVPLARRRWQMLLLFAAVMQLGVTILHYPELLGVSAPQLDRLAAFSPNWLFFGYIFWFSLGVAGGFHLQGFAGWLLRYRWVLLGSAILWFVVGVVEWELVLRASPAEWLGQERLLSDEFYSAAILLSFLAFKGLAIPWPTQLAEIGTKSYGIYLSHSLFQEWSSKIVYHVVPGLLALQVLFVAILVFLGLAVPLLLMAAVRRSPANRYYRYVFG